MPRPLLPPRGVFISTMMIYNREVPPSVVYTWIQLRGLAWDRTETPPLSMPQLSDLTGKSQSTLYGHMALLRSWGALRMRPSAKGTFIVSFPADTGEFYLDGDFLPPDSGILDSENQEKPDPSPSSPINQLDINAVEERERDDQDPDPEINQLDLSREGEFQITGINSEKLEKFQDFGTISDLPPDLDGADPIKIYRALTGIRPNKPQREQLKSLIQDTNIWYASVEHWQSHGWNPKNIAGILELYQRGGPSACRYCSHENEPQDKSLSALNQLRDEIKEPTNGSS